MVAVDWAQFKLWLKSALPALGGPGLLLSAFIDSSFVPLPLVTDLTLMALSSRHPMRMPYYAGMASLGSLVGCISIYHLARKGGLAYYRRNQGQLSDRIRRFMQEHPMACVFFPAVAPFPLPFKPFVIAQGVFQVPFVTFVIGTLVGRACRFYIEGFLGARYGTAAKQVFLNLKFEPVVALLGLVTLFLLIRRTPLFSRRRGSQEE
jgi:membrane protein YqaA with SNARE-associated domain